MRIDAFDPVVREATCAGARPFGFHVPGWAQYVVADHDGTVWAFLDCPAPDATTRSWANASSGGRYALLGSCRQELVYWEKAIFHRHGGLWVSRSDEEHEARDAGFRQATVGSLWAIALIAMLVMAIFAVRATFD
jgi:hypothetical protein